jgi:pimeloyl-ACP methyl ester carboxylesterase
VRVIDHDDVMGHFEHEADGLRIVFDVDLVGAGPPVVLAHALAFASWYDPLIAALDGWSLLRYRRTVVGEPHEFSIEGDAAALVALIDHVGLERPHVVGHSYGGLVALGMVRATPSRFASLALLEPAPTGFLPPEVAAAAMAPMFNASRSRGPVVAMHEFLQLVCGDGGASALDAAVPGAVATAEAAAPQFFDVELPAVAALDVDTSLLDQLEVPVLNVVGAASTPRFVDGAAAIQRWLPQAQHHVVPGVGHLLMAVAPHDVASRLDAFWRAAA